MRGSRAFSGILSAIGLLIAAAPVIAQSPWQHTIGYYNPQHWWRLGETAGTIAYDQSSSLNGTYRNGVALGAGGALPTDPDTSAYFDGADDRVELGDTLNVSGSQVTMMAWVYPTGTSGGDRLIVGKVNSNGSSLQDHWLSLIQRGSRAVFRIKAGGSTTECVSSFGALAANQWSLVAGSYNGSSASIIVVRAGATYSGGAAKSGLINNSGSVASAIGSTSVGTQTFQGRIDEVVVYSRTFSSSEQNTIYTSLIANGIFYVRPDGNDANTGTGPAAHQAWRTIQKALTTPANVGPTDIIKVYPGSYAAPSSITVDGTAPQPIFIQAVRDGSVVGWPSGDVRIVAGYNSSAINLSYDSYLFWTDFEFDGHSGASTIRLSNAAGIEFERCKIYGGAHGVELTSSSSARLRNCLIYGNSLDGVFCPSGNTVALEHCTIVRNGSDGLDNASSSSSIVNSIVALNGDDGIDSDTTFSHTYNLVAQNVDDDYRGVAPHSTEISANPDFVDPNGNDFRLAYSSAAIDVATLLSPRAGFDIDHVSRPQGEAPDLGCYEYADVGVWLFEEGSGSITADSSGNGNPGTLVNTAWVADRCGYALQLNGVSSWVDLGRPTLRGGQYTVSAWFRTEGTTDQTILGVTSPGTGNHQMVLQVNGNGSIRYTHRNPPSTTGGSTLLSGVGYNDGQWHHVAAVKSAAQVDLYVDGLHVAQTADSSGTTEDLDFVIGKLSKTQDERYFVGEIDELRIFGSAMTIGGVRNLYGVQGHWKFDESAGSIAPDSSPFGRDGQLYNGPLWQPSGGRNAGALQFDGQDDYVEANSSAEANFETELSIAAWVRIADPDASDYLRILSKKSQWNAPTGFEFEYNPGLNRLTFTGAGTNQLIAYEVDLNAGWHHLVVSIQPRDDGQLEGTFFVDGEPLQQALVTVDSQTVNRIDTYDCCPLTARPGSDLDPLLANSVPVTIAKQGSPGTGGYFHGLLDDVRFYNRAVCDAEVLDLYGSGPPRLRIKSWVELP